MTSTGQASGHGPGEAEDPLRAVHTPNFPALLRQLGASLMVTTYQACKLVLVRDQGDHLNTHFRTFQASMGLALDGTWLAAGTTIQVSEYAHRRSRPDARSAYPAHLHWTERDWLCTAEHFTLGGNFL